MSGTRVLALLALFVVSARCLSWDIVLCVDERLEFYYNGTLTYSEEIPSVISIHSIAYDPVQDRVLFYHSSNLNMTISSYDIATRKIYPLFNGISNGNRNARIAYDPVTQVIFWKEGKSIYSFSINPVSPKEAVRENLLFNLDYYCNDIAVDSCGGYIYWVTYQAVERARFDGSKRKEIVAGAAVDRRSLVLDQQTQKIYWLETIFSSDSYTYQLAIESADFNGKYRSTLYIAKNVTFGNTLAISKDFVYAQYHKQVGIWQIPKTGSQNVTSKLYSKSRSNCFSCHLLAANYTIQEQIQGRKDCDNLQHPIPSTSSNNNNNNMPTTTTKKTKSTVSICQHYCLQGNCSVSAEGKPKCSCKAGYSGKRCEVNVCYKHCLNGGVCSLNEDKPVCQCTSDYDGERCDVPIYLLKCIQTVSNLKDMLNADITSVALGKGVKSTCA